MDELFLQVEIFYREADEWVCSLGKDSSLLRSWQLCGESVFVNSQHYIGSVLLHFLCCICLFPRPFHVVLMSNE